MQSGFNSGGGLPDFYTGGGRSVGNTMNNHPSQPQYNRSQLPGMFLDPAVSQIGRQSQNLHHATSGLIGKRTLAEYQFHQPIPYHQQSLTSQQNMYLRSLKPRTTANFQHSSFQHSSPISPLSPIDFSSGSSYTGSDNSSSSTTSSLLSQRYGLPVHQQLRPQPNVNPSFQATSLPYINNRNSLQPFQTSQSTIQNRVSVSASAIESEKKMINPMINPVLVSGSGDSEKKMIDHRLQELEKQLLDDNDEEEEAGDAVSVITKTSSDWTETIQNLISPNQTIQKPISPSPTSSSSSSSSVVSPATLTCSKQSLMEAASAIAEGKPEPAAEILTRLTQVTNPRPSSEQKVLDFMASALKSRVNPVDNPPPVNELFTPEHAGSTQFLYDLVPCFRLGWMAANVEILEATLEDQSTTNKVHVIDFDIGQGGQYKHLLRALSTRQNGNGKPSLLKITTVAPDNNGGEDRLRTVRDNLSQVAKQLRVGLEFHVAVSHQLSELNREALGCGPDEPVAVNFAFKMYRMADESVSTDNPRDELLRRVKGLAPRVVTLVEQELNTNTAPFMARVNECCAYYGALMDSIEAVAKDSPDRVKAEEALRRKIVNSVACEGRDRVERCEVFGKWRARMGMAGFELRAMSQSVTESLSRLDYGNRVHPGFTVKVQNGAVCFGWTSRNLTVASAWR
ncbi:scarecrow-like protein 8 [Argentina anserina]|uniref:scarecrow-like protein 8 n=1 Tax=Argentina anserina TaxID=57926 RepID=UPI00217652B4|nr:scarecrow-like protein 8 [Potentilla anserina]